MTYAGMRDELNEALKQLDRVAFMYPRDTAVRQHVDFARSQVISAMQCVLKHEGSELRERLAELEKEP